MRHLVGFKLLQGGLVQLLGRGNFNYIRDMKKILQACSPIGEKRRNPAAGEAALEAGGSEVASEVDLQTTEKGSLFVLKINL